MKSVSSMIKWILFVPICLMSVALALFDGVYPGSVADFLATNRNGVAQIIAFSVLGLFVVSFVISLFDRKMSPAHMLKKNYFCGITSVGAAIAMAAHAAFEVTNMIDSKEPVKAIPVIIVTLTAVGGITMLYLGLNHFSGSNSTKKVSLLYLSLPLWCCAHLVERFLNNTATPVAAGDSMDLIMFVALALFFINVAMIHAVITVKNSVKSAINYGLPAVVISLVYCVNEIFAVVNSDSFVALDLIPAISYGFIALYIMGFVAELSFKSKTIDEQFILVDDKDEEKVPNEYYDDTESEDASEYDAFEEAEEATAVENVEVFYEDEHLDETASSDENHEVYEETVMQSDTSKNAVPMAVRIVEDDDDDVVGLDDDIDFFDEDDVADELFDAAKKQDQKRSEKFNDVESGSDNEMILDGDSKRVEPDFVPNTKDEKLHGPTKRVPVMYEDDDFILSVDSGDNDLLSASDDDDVSAFILDSDEDKEEAPVKKTYEERLDEIDKLIISIQGGDASEENK